jgi:thiol-disulfide isomerase/thioredoxin
MVLNGILLKILRLAMLSALLGCAIVSSQTEDFVDRPAPSARLMLLDGTQIPLIPDPGRTAVVLFWATWCPRSRYIVEDFEQLAREFTSRADLDFFAVSIDKNEDFEVLKSRIREQDLKTVQHCFSGNDIEDEAFYSFKGHTIPFVVVIDSKGIVRVVTPHIGEARKFLSP